jgi:hypothetical protein
MEGPQRDVKALYTPIEPTALAKQNEFTVQLRVFLY